MNPLILTVQLTPFFHSYTPRMFCETALFNWACVLGTPLSWGMGKKSAQKLFADLQGGGGVTTTLERSEFFKA